MRIVHVANFYGPRSGGIRTAMHALARHYLEQGHEPVLVVPGARPGVTTAGGFRVVTVAAPPVPLSGGYRAVVRTGDVRRLLEALRPDHLEVSDRTTLVGAGDWAREAGVPSVLLLHERVDGVLRAFLPGGGPDGRLREVGARTMPLVADRYNARILSRFDRLVATTGYAAAEVERLRVRPFARGLVLPPLHRVPLGVDLGLFRPDRRTAEARARYAHTDVALVVVASRLSTEKRVDLAVDAAAQVLRDGRAVRLVVAGAGPLLTALRRRAEQAGLPHRFLSFVPDRERLATLLACADVVVAPGPIETFGLAALEALASGTPVVCSMTSALPEVVGGAGAAGAPEPASLALAIHDVLDRDMAGRRAAARARADLFPWSATGEAMLALHRRAAGPACAVRPDPVLAGGHR